MKKTNNLVLIFMFVLSLSFCQAAEESSAKAEVEATGWPNLAKYKTTDNSEINIFVENVEREGKVTSCDQLLPMMPKFPRVIKSMFMDLRLELIRLENQPAEEQSNSSLNDVTAQIDLFNKAFCDDYCKRMPDETQANFQVSMSRFEQCFENLRKNKKHWPEDVIKCEIDKAWDSLKEALKI